MPGGDGRAAGSAGLPWDALPVAASGLRRPNRGGLGRAKLLRVALLSCIAFAHHTMSLAGNLGYGAGAYLSYESNINRVETNPERELTEAFFGGLSYSETTGDVRGRLYAYVEHRHFTQHTFNDDTRGYLEGNGVWTIMPKRLTWVVDDTFQDVVLNVTQPNSPGNLTKSNSFNTGPELIFPLGSVNSLVGGVRYGRFDIKDSIADNERIRGYGRLVHTTPSRANFSLNYEATRIKFEPGNPFSEARRQDAFASYETASASQGIYSGDSARIDAGQSHVIQYAPDGSTNTLPGHLIRVRLSKSVSREFTVNAGYADQISDTYSDLIAGIAGSSGAFVPTGEGVYLVSGGAATADLYHSKRGDLGFTARGGDIEYTLQPYARTVDFQTLDQDYRQVGGVFFLRWSFSAATRFEAGVNYSARTYDSLDRKDTDRNYALALDLKLGRTLRFAVAAGEYQRESTAPGNSYVDKRLMLLLGYSDNYELRTMLSR